MGRGQTEFITKFSTRINVRPVCLSHGEWAVSIITSDGSDPVPDEYVDIDLCLADARELAIALYHAVCLAEEEGGH